MVMHRDVTGALPCTLPTTRYTVVKRALEGPHLLEVVAAPDGGPERTVRLLGPVLGLDHGEVQVDDVHRAGGGGVGRFAVRPGRVAGPAAAVERGHREVGERRRVEFLLLAAGLALGQDGLLDVL